MHFLPFPWPINYNYVFRCNKFCTHSLLIWFWLKIWLFSFPWNYGIAYGHVLRALKCTNEWKIVFEVISWFNIDKTSSWWKSWTSRGACSSWSWTPSSLVLLYFSELSHLGDLIASRPHFRLWTWNHLWRLLWNWRHFCLCMVFNSQRWTLSLVTRSDSPTTF
jgi:hypothetical protein